MRDQERNETIRSHWGPGLHEEGRRRGGRGRGPGGPGGRMRRGDIRVAVLAVLQDGPGHGYDVMQRLEEKSGGAWRPSPGSVYPTLQLLEDEGLARSTEVDGKRVYELTESGVAEAEAKVAAAGGAPWELGGRSSERGALREAVMQLGAAARQVATGGNKEQTERAVGILKDARKQLYAILAED